MGTRKKKFFSTNYLVLEMDVTLAKIYCWLAPSTNYLNFVSLSPLDTRISQQRVKKQGDVGWPDTQYSVQ